MNNEERYEMSYLAGAFDGDGCFSLCRKVENSNRSTLYYPMVQFGCKDDVLINMLKEKFGGYVHETKKHVSKEGFERQRFFRYKLEKRTRCKPFLEQIIPFLKIKQDRAQEILDFINENPFVRGSRRLDEEILLRRERAYRKIRAMNQEKRSASKKRRKEIPLLENDLFWSYVSGLMDTDGSFSINKNGYAPTISLSMSDMRSIEYIENVLKKGFVSVIKAKTCKLGYTYRWSCKKLDDVEDFLNGVIPYLRMKKENAETLLEFCKKRTPTTHRRGGIPKEELKLREFYHQKLYHLNKYGVFKLSLIDLEAQEQGDRAEGESHRERLNEMAS